MFKFEDYGQSYVQVDNSNNIELALVAAWGSATSRYSWKWEWVQVMSSATMQRSGSTAEERSTGQSGPALSIVTANRCWNFL